MQCPECNTEMSEGEFVVAGTFWRALLAVGRSWQSLWFWPRKPQDGDDKKWLILDCNINTKGFCCPECSTSVLIRPRCPNPEEKPLPLVWEDRKG